MQHGYPESLASVPQWAIASGLDARLAHRRYLHFAVLHCIACDPLLSQLLIFRGGAALQLYYRGPRESKDLDFQILRLPSIRRNQSEPDHVKEQLNAILNRRLPEYFDGQKNWLEWLADIKIEMTPVEKICECTTVAPRAADPNRRIKIATLEEIIADKLACMFLARMRRRPRPQDVFDIASTLASGQPLNRASVAELAKRKSARWGFEFNLAAYNQELRDHMLINYENLAKWIGPDFIPFDAAWARIVEFLSHLQV